jgi:hypothetical protein
MSQKASHGAMVDRIGLGNGSASRQRPAASEPQPVGVRELDFATEADASPPAVRPSFARLVIRLASSSAHSSEIAYSKIWL